MAQSGSLTAEEARMACKTLVWLQDTSTGDRSELSIPNRDAYLWDRIAAPSAGECDGREGVCFLRTARARADAAQVVVVNHALLLSDLMSGGSAIPPFDNLIIDEAHHLEEEASRQFGYEIPWHAVDDLGARLAQEVGNVRSGLRVANVAQSRHEQVEGLVGETEAGARRLRETWGLLSSTVAEFVQHHQESGDGNQLRVTLSTRKQPAWSGVEGRWEAFNEALLEAERLVDRLLLALEPLESASLVDSLLELRSWHDRAGELRGRVESFVVSPDIDETVYWVNLARQERTPVLCAAPLRVGPILDESLFSQKRCVVMTSATLSVGGTMDYFCRTVGLSDATELVVGSPFDYEKSALVLVCPEMPGPSDAGYQQALQDALVRVARASQGGVLALFTAHAALQAARRGIKAVLESEGMTVLAQGLDGSPRQLMESARENRNTVLLGTSSLWEGVDLPGEHLRVVVVARLPFNVPTDPVFAARSEHYDNPFNDYAVPQAVLRFRQGFGRLIRSQSDRGVVVALDSRIQSRGYGSVFLRSIPQCTVKRVTLRGLGEEVAGWLDG
jgi:DNA polymerase-3 subunit epsilon/ATP-dependent DNA helicase DinG